MKRSAINVIKVRMFGAAALWFPLPVPQNSCWEGICVETGAIATMSRGRESS
jgi:hypothetical protein